MISALQNMESSARHVTLFYIALIILTGYSARGEDDNDCPADGRTWLPFGRNCYHFIHGAEDVAKSYSLQDAKDMCRGYELLTVKSADENNFVVNYSPSVWKGKMNVWLGLYYDSDNSNPIIVVNSSLCLKSTDIHGELTGQTGYSRKAYHMKSRTTEFGKLELWCDRSFTYYLHLIP